MPKYISRLSVRDCVCTAGFFTALLIPYNFFDAPSAFLLPTHNDWMCYLQNRNQAYWFRPIYKHLLKITPHWIVLLRASSQPDAILAAFLLHLPKKYSDAFSKKTHSLPHTFSNYKALAKMIFPRRLYLLPPNAKEAHAIHINE